MRRSTGCTPTQRRSRSNSRLPLSKRRGAASLHQRLVSSSERESSSTEGSTGSAPSRARPMSSQNSASSPGCSATGANLSAPTVSRPSSLASGRCPARSFTTHSGQSRLPPSPVYSSLSRQNSRGGAPVPSMPRTKKLSEFGRCPRSSKDQAGLSTTPFSVLHARCSSEVTCRWSRRLSALLP